MHAMPWFIDYALHLDRHLPELLAQYHLWLYAIVAGIIFAETGVVVMAFLPGDSLLFALGALCAIDANGTLRLVPLMSLLAAAAIAGNTVNFAIGRALGERAFSGHYRFLRRDYLTRTREFFARHGGRAVVLSLFVPIVRTFSPFVAGVGGMTWLRFCVFNVLGGAGWVLLFVIGGYLFGNVPLVKDNFSIVTLLIVLVSLVPLLFALRRPRTASNKD
jgi:membrane-associated protein